MSKKLYIAVIIVLLILLLFTGAYSVLHYFFNYKSTDWFKENVKSGEYTIIGEMIGETIMNGDNDICISIIENKNKRKVLSFKTEISNENEPLTEENYAIDSNDDYIKLYLINRDKSISGIYIFYYSDFSEILS